MKGIIADINIQGHVDLLITLMQAEREKIVAAANGSAKMALGIANDSFSRQPRLTYEEFR